MADQEEITETPEEGLRIPEPKDRLDVILDKFTSTEHAIRGLENTVRDLRLSLIDLTEQLERLKEGRR
jgi:hypothetical protein